MNFSNTSRNIVMILIGMMVAMALDMLAREYYIVGIIELIITAVMFRIFDKIVTEGEEK
jgi:hypothetical protein